MSLEKCQNNENLSIDEVLDKLSLLYTNAIDSLRSAIAAYVTDGQLPDADARKKDYLPILNYVLSGMVKLIIA